MLALALTVAFGLELVALFALGAWGVHSGQNTLTQTLFGVGTAGRHFLGCISFAQGCGEALSPAPTKYPQAILEGCNPSMLS